MFENALKRTIKRIILENNEHIVDGLTVQGQQVRLEQITTSGHSPIRATPYISIGVRAAREYDTGGNVTRNPSDVDYTLVISMTNIAMLQYEEDEPYEEIDATHSDICDRIISVLRDNSAANCLVDEQTGVKFFIIRDSEISRENVEVTWEDDSGGEFPGIWTTIRLQIRQRNTDDTKLW